MFPRTVGEVRDYMEMEFHISEAKQADNIYELIQWATRKKKYRVYVEILVNRYLRLKKVGN